MVHAVALLVNFAVLLYVGRNQWFFFDEWEPIANRAGLGDVLASHSEHAFIIPGLSYHLLLFLFGLRTYLPFLLVTIIFQLLLTHLLWRLMLRAAVQPLVATAVAFIFGMLGTGYENLLWAFQMSLIGSLVCAAAALLLSDHAGPMRKSDWWAVVILSLAWMFSGVGITSALVVALAAILRRRWSAALIFAVVPTAQFFLWSYFYGGESRDSSYSLFDSLLKTPEFIINGLVTAYGGIVGLKLAGPVLLALVIIGLVAATRDTSKCLVPAIAGFSGSVFFLLLAGIRRATLGIESSESSRYQHIVLALGLVAIAVAVDTALRHAANIVPGALVALVLLAGVQVGQLEEQSRVWAEKSGEVRGTILAAGDRVRNGEFVLSSNQVYPQWAPDLDVGELRRIVDNGWLPPGDGVRPEDLALTNWLQVGVLTAGQNLVPLGPVRLLGINKATSTPEENGCISFLPTEASATIAIEAVDPAAVELVSEEARAISVQTAADPSLTSISSAKDLAVTPGTSELVLARKGTIIVLTIPDLEPIKMCGLQSP
jgi:hypothetical protein